MFNKNFLTCHSLYTQTHSHILSKCFALKISQHSQLYVQRILLETQSANGKEITYLLGVQGRVVDIDDIDI